MISDANYPHAITASDIFECRQCGECCHGYGGTFIMESDIQAIADYIGTSTEDVIDTYSSRSGSKLVLVQGLEPVGISRHQVPVS